MTYSANSTTQEVAGILLEVREYISLIQKNNARAVPVGLLRAIPSL